MFWGVVMQRSDPETPSPPSLPPGVDVEVRRRYDSEWASGFEIHAWRDDGYLVRRQSDGVVLPKEFSANDVRRRR